MVDGEDARLTLRFARPEIGYMKSMTLLLIIVVVLLLTGGGLGLSRRRR
jgi:LPXTG-motif cell wall-anchored protein